MPLRAIINNEEIISINCDDEKWNILQKKSKNRELEIRLPCCNNHGYLRKSSLGLKHFAHKTTKINCDWKPESLEHLLIKQAIIEGCKNTDWIAIPEFSEDDWRADVLVSKGKIRIAFEVQWSPQTYEETIRRQERYKKSNIRGCWYFKKIPTSKNYYQPNLINNNELPAFELIYNSNNELVILFDKKEITVIEFTEQLITGKIKHRKYYTISKGSSVDVIFFNYSCPRCNKQQDLWTINTNGSNPKSYCGKSIFKSTCSLNVGELNLENELFQSILQYSKTSEGSNLKIGQVKKVFNEIMDREISYLDCHNCGHLFWHQFMEKVEPPESGVKKTIILSETWNIPSEHWCYSKNENFCLF